jgi:hypothetical protein
MATLEAKGGGAEQNLCTVGKRELAVAQILALSLIFEIRGIVRLLGC